MHKKDNVKMNYSDLRNLIEQKTIKLIKNENWDEILRILQTCPEQIFFFRLILEEKLRDSKELNEFPIEKIKYENNSQDNPNAPFCLRFIFKNIINVKRRFIFPMLYLNTVFFNIFSIKLILYAKIDLIREYTKRL